MRWVRGLFRDGVDPVTGDRLTAGERASWAVQHILRRWSWLLATQLVTLGCWLWGAYNAAVLVWWNLGASDYAVVVESLTAMVLILQQIRDAVVSRQVRDIVVRVEENTAMTRRTAEQLDQHVNVTAREQARMLAASQDELAALRAEVAALRELVVPLHTVIVGGASVRVRGERGRFVSVKSVPGVH